MENEIEIWIKGQDRFCEKYHTNSVNWVTVSPEKTLWLAKNRDYTPTQRGVPSGETLSFEIGGYSGKYLQTDPDLSLTIP